MSRQKKKKLVKKSNVVTKQQRPVPPIRSILKHSHVEVVSETNTSSSNLKGSDQVINNGGQKSDRRVSFVLDKDDVLVLDPSSTRSAFSDCFEQNDVNPFRTSEGRSIMSGESNRGVSNSMEVGVNNDVVSVSTRHNVDSQNVKGKILLPNIHDQSSMRSHPCWNNASANQVIHHENNLHLFDHVYVDSPQKLPPVHSASPAPLEERQCGLVRTQCGSSFPGAHSFYGNSADHLINPVNGVAALGSISSPAPAVSLSENAVGTFPTLAESSANDSQRHALNWDQSAVASKEKGASVNDGFFCLPLNSKGELIQLNSGLIDRFDQMNEASSNIACSSRIPVCNLILPRSTRDHFIENNEKLLVDTELTRNQLTLFPLHSNLQENQNRYLSARFDVTEPGTSERETESGRFFHSNLMDHPLNRCRYYGKLQNKNLSREIYPENSSSMMANPTRQTMRLMGKDVAVGGNGKEVQEPEAINFWKNSTLIENCLTNPIQENPMRSQRNFLQDRVFYPAGFHNNHVTQKNLLPNAPQFRYPGHHPCLDRRSGIMYQRSDSVMNLNERFNNIHAFSPSSTDQAFNMAPSFQAPFISGPETLRFGNTQPSAFSTNSHYMCPNRYENSFELGYNQNLHPAKLGTFNFPFLQPDDGNHVHLPWFHSSKSCLPPWMLHSCQREEAPTANYINGYYYPFISSGADVLVSPPSIHSIPSHLQMKNIPIAPRVQPPCIRTSSVVDRSKFNTLISVNDSDLSSKKRPVGELVDSTTKRQKISSLEMNNYGFVPEWTRGNFIDDLQSNPETTTRIHGMNWDRAVNSVGNIPNVTQIDHGVVISTNNEHSKVECMARSSGPIKLTAGAKHILKPNQSMDIDNKTKPTYSTIPSAGLVHSVGLAGSQKNSSTQVYSF